MSKNLDESGQEISEEDLQKQLEQQKNDLLKDIQKNLSIVSRTYSGSYAYLKLNYCEKELTQTYDLLRSFEHLRFLELSNNKLTELYDIQNLKYLQKIDISQNEFENFDIFKKEDISFDYLEEINLSKNKLKEITFSNCKSLKRVYLQENQIENLVLQDCYDIDVLEVRANKLKHIQNLEKLDQLKIFFGANNKFEDLQQFKQLKKIHVLHLRQNLIGEKQENIQRENFLNLQVLNLRQNMIKNVEFLDFVNFLGNLEKINFIDNPSQKIQEEDQKEIQEDDQYQQQEDDQVIESITTEQFIKDVLHQKGFLKNTNIKLVNKIEINDDLKQQYSEEKDQLNNQPLQICIGIFYIIYLK